MHTNDWYYLNAKAIDGFDELSTIKEKKRWSDEEEDEARQLENYDSRASYKAQELKQ